MEKYKNLNGNSNVDSYEISFESITVLFKGSSMAYTYSYRSAGRFHVENMKMLAKKGSGLNSYIKSYCNQAYEKKFYAF